MPEKKTSNIISFSSIIVSLDLLLFPSRLALFIHHNLSHYHLPSALLIILLTKKILNPKNRIPLKRGGYSSWLFCWLNFHRYFHAINGHDNVTSHLHMTIQSNINLAIIEIQIIVFSLTSLLIITTKDNRSCLSSYKPLDKF